MTPRAPPLIFPAQASCFNLLTVRSLGMTTAMRRTLVSSVMSPGPLTSSSKTMNVFRVAAGTMILDWKAADRLVVSPLDTDWDQTLPGVVPLQCPIGLVRPEEPARGRAIVPDHDIHLDQGERADAAGCRPVQSPMYRSQVTGRVRL